MTRVISSPLQRAVATATAIADAHGLAVEIDARLVELDYGEWDGRKLTDVPPEAWAAWRTEAGFAPPGGETLADVTARVASFCADVLGDELVIAVSHVSPIKAAVCQRAAGRRPGHVADAARRRLGHPHRPSPRREPVPPRLQRLVAGALRGAVVASVHADTRRPSRFRPSRRR